MKIAVAVSGGVDSSVAAALLKEHGHEIVGVTMQHFDNAAYGFPEDKGIAAAVRDAKRVCEALDIEHFVYNTSEKFKKYVESDFITGYSSGRTPNPCTVCNPNIKWGAFWDLAKQTGAEKIATGHYVKLVQQNDKYLIFKAKDDNRDQSYMLWQLSQKQLSETIFPLSEFSKDKIRLLAKNYGIPVHAKSDSQEICFIYGHYADFLKKHVQIKPGDIALQNGKVIGKHKGLPFYTIGQRKGLDTPWTCPLFVQKIDVAKNLLIVTENPDDLAETKFEIKDINLIGADELSVSDKLAVQIRYNSKPVKVKELQNTSAGYKVILDTPTRAITPGQSAVFYLEDRLLGGGIIM